MTFKSFVISSLLVFIISFQVQAHPQDEAIIQDIEQGVMSFDEAQVQQELAAAEERKKQRKLNALSRGEKIQKYIISGIEHIVPKGLDHILFVAGLFFSTVLISKLIWQVSAFTLAHTITLAMAASGMVVVNPDIVEPLIALSIAYIAVENIRQKEANKFRPLVVFIFGLLHGLGFASVLQEYGLPKNDMLTALISFNVGVELGQLIVLAVLSIVCIWFAKKDWYRPLVRIPASVLIGVIGAYWFIERI